MTIESQLSERLHELADDAGSAAPTQRLIERGRASRRRRAVLAGTSLAVIAAAALYMGTPSAPDAADPSDATAQRPPASPQMRLAAAITASQSTSYQLKVTTKTREVPGSTPTVWSGAFDPATDTGFVHMPFGEGPGFAEERLVNGVDYGGSAGADEVIHWYVFPGTHTSLQFNGPFQGALGGSSDPDDLLAVLSQSGATVTQEGGGFRFAYTPTTLPEYAASDGYAGEVALDSSGRIATVSYVRTVDWVKPGRSPGNPIHVEVSIEFSGYGSPVTVEEPTGAVPAPTGN